MNRPFVIAVAGGTGSGKTTVADRLSSAVGEGGVAVLRLDSYYADRVDLSPVERAAINYDHPDAFDWTLLFEHAEAMIAGRVVSEPIYDFTDVPTSAGYRHHRTIPGAADRGHPGAVSARVTSHSWRRCGRATSVSSSRRSVTPM